MIVDGGGEGGHTGKSRRTYHDRGHSKVMIGGGGGGHTGKSRRTYHDRVARLVVVVFAGH